MVHYILLGTRRTGSTVVSNSLADHPQVLQYGEIFLDVESVNAGDERFREEVLSKRTAEAARQTMGREIMRYLPNGLPVCRDTDDGHEYLARLFSQPVSEQAIGFKIFYDHARRGPIASAWDYLDRHTEIRILHIQRRNWLESLISVARAKRNRVWHSMKSLTTEPFAITPARCQEYFGEMERWRDVIQPLLSNHPVLELEYQQLLEDFSGTMARTCDFLEVNSEIAMVPSLVKIAQHEPHIELTNYQELQSHFRNTPYAEFFP